MKLFLSPLRHVQESIEVPVFRMLTGLSVDKVELGIEDIDQLAKLDPQDLYNWVTKISTRFNAEVKCNG